MSQRRMISLEVVDTDAFLDMPVSSQLLYFHLNARADDDGFVANPKKVTRMLNVGTDDLKMLIAKKFVIAFEDGVCVIKHWRINNFIRKDIYKETKYLDLKKTLFIRSNGAYTLTDDGRSMALPSGHFQLEDVNSSLTKRQPRLGKIRIGKDSKGKSNTSEPSSQDIVSLIDSFKEVNPSYKNWFKNTTQRSACRRLIEQNGLEKLLKIIELLPKSNTMDYMPVITTPVQLENKFAQLAASWQKIKNKQPEIL